MTWNYRIVRYSDGSLGLHEVHYDGQGNPVAMTDSPATFVCEEDEDTLGIIGALEMALKDAKSLPVFTPPKSWAA